MPKILCIGDPHFKSDNTEETSAMTDQLYQLAIDNRPDLIVVLGDLLHDHEKTTISNYKRAADFMEKLQSTGIPTVLLIGNHDRPNNQTFLNDLHFFTALKQWKGVSVVDTTLVKRFVFEDGTYTFMFMPYVPVGRFQEAIGDHIVPNLDAIFCHQEFLGAKMGAIVSKDGDFYPPDYPLCISGHIHDYDRLQENLLYPGTPIQHGWSDTLDKGVSMIEIKKEGWSETRHQLNIMKKITVSLTPEEALVYVPPENTRVRVKIVGSAESIKNVMASKAVKDLKLNGVTISQKAEAFKIPASFCTKYAYTKRLYMQMETEAKEVRDLFEEVIRS